MGHEFFQCKTKNMDYCLEITLARENKSIFFSKYCLSGKHARYRKKKVKQHNFIIKKINRLILLMAVIFIHAAHIFVLDKL